MSRLILLRLLQLPVVLWLVGTLSFFMALSVPGEPIQFARDPTPEVRKARRAEFQLDEPLWVQYFLYLHALSPVGCGELSGPVFGDGDEEPMTAENLLTWKWDWKRPFVKRPDLRVSIPTGVPVARILAQALPVSLLLGLVALSVAFLLGTVAGMLAAVYANRWPDYMSLFLVLAGVSVPSFVTGTALLMIGSVSLKIFPAGGWGTPGHVVLPAIALALPYAAYIARLTRTGLIEALSQDYIRTARAKGLPPHEVLLSHAFRNAFLPVLSYLGPAAAYILTGGFVVENIFTVPGLGTHFVAAVKALDYFLIVGTVVVYSALLVVFNLLTDLAYGWLDPRIRLT